jgi:predicted ATPase/class 3 adenylate cyclase
VPELPTGTVTFLFTDVEGSTRLWEERPDAMGDALARHDQILLSAVAAHEGYVVKQTGDGVHAAFATASAATSAAVAAQRALQLESWDAVGDLRVRIGLHTGAAEVRDGDYYGTAVNRAARLMAIAHGGQIVCSRATADLVRDDLGPDVTLLDLGEHRLRDLESAEQVHQVTDAELRAEFPPLLSLDVLPGNLPLQVSAFVGRDDELEAIVDLVARERLVTLTGPGGVGKTRLAIQAAAVVLPDFRDGAWFVDLAPVSDPEFVASEITTALGLIENRRATPEEALVRTLGHRNLLLVLDNCEHVVDVAARIVDQLVRSCRAVTVLATSQESLGVDGERVYSVRPLDDDDSTRLFASRAEAVRHGFELTGDNLEAVAELCRRLDGIPLAIELAAARTASMSPSAILERLDERFRLLAQGRRTARSRHQTLRAAVDWSYQLLDDVEQLVFARLSVFAGAFSLEAAEAVVSDDRVDTLDVLDALSGLVAKSMVALDDTGAVDRYRLTETMRDYGHQLLADRGELRRVEELHAAYYSRLAEESALRLVGPDDQLWRDRVASEYADLRAALMFLRGQPDPAGFVNLVYALTTFWTQLGHHWEGVEWILQVVDLPTDRPPQEQAARLGYAGMAAASRDYERGATLVERSLAISAAAAEPPSAYALNSLAMFAVVSNRPDDAVREAEAAVAAARATGDEYVLADILASASNFIAIVVDDVRAIELADEGLAIARRLGNRYLLGMSLGAAGMARYRSEPALALEFFRESLDAGLYNQARNPQTHFFMAIVHLQLRDVVAAAREVCIALAAMQERGEPYYESMALSLAALILARRDPDLAVRILALVDRMREDGVFIGATRDLEAQQALRKRLEAGLAPERFAARWAEGRASNLDDLIAITLDELALIAEADEPTGAG